MTTISQAIRHSALTWPMAYLGDVESPICHAFQTWKEPSFRMHLIYGDEEALRARTFMLFVAEALEDCNG